MSTMDEHLDQLLAEMPDPAQKVVRNILDEPIPENSEKALTYAFVSKKTSTSTPASHMEGPREEGHLGGV